MNDNITINMMTYEGGQVSGQVTVLGLLLDVPAIDIDDTLSRSECEHLIINKALELNPDLVLIKPYPRFLIDDGKLQILKGNTTETLGDVVSVTMPVPLNAG